MAKRKAVKSKTDAIIDALVLPYGGHRDGQDCHGTHFGPTTDFKISVLPLPPVIYAHGYPLDKDKVADRVVVGETLDRWFDEEGGWARLRIFADTPLASEIMESHRNGSLKFSSTALLAAMNSDDPSLYDVWLPGEFSVVTGETGVNACNLLSRAEPSYLKMVTESLYNDNNVSEEEKAALKALLDSQTTANADNNQPAGGDGDKEDLEALAESEEESDDMKPEELKASLDASLAPIMARLEVAEGILAKADKGGDIAPEQKTDAAGIDPALASHIQGTAERSKADGAVNALAASLVDGYIAQGKIAPLEREGQIKLAAAAINADGRKKTEGGALAAYETAIASRSAVSVTGKEKLAGFGRTEVAGQASEADIKAMTAAAQE